MSLVQRYRQSGVAPPFKIPVDNPDGSQSSQRLMGFDDESGHFNVPSLWSGEELSPLEALARAIVLEETTAHRFQRYPTQEAAAAAASEESLALGRLPRRSAETDYPR
jgi:hypothetical protein